MATKIKNPKQIKGFLAETIEKIEDNPAGREALFTYGAVGGVLGLTALWLHQHHKHRQSFDHVPIQSFKRPRVSGEEEQIKSSTLTAALLSGVAVSALGRKLPPFARRNLFLGGSFALNLSSDLANRNDPAVSILAGTGATVAGYFALGAGQKWSRQGVDVFRKYISENGEQGALYKLYSIVERLKKSSPFLDKMLSTSNMGFAAAVATIPIAHGIIRRLMIGHSQRNAVPTEPLKYNQNMPSQAGYQNTRDDGNWATDPSLPSGTMHVRGRLRTHYNHQKALSYIK